MLCLNSIWEDGEVSVAAVRNRVGGQLTRCIASSALTIAIRNYIAQQLPGDAGHFSGSAPLKLTAHQKSLQFHKKDNEVRSVAQY